jgi:putative FmdB family regulatory protein
MPIYEYECDLCHYHFERLQRFSDEPIRVCPHCQGSVHRIIQPVGIVFKGSGFYITDNRKGNGRSEGRIRDGAEGSKGDGQKEETSTVKDTARSHNH